MFTKEYKQSAFKALDMFEGRGQFMSEISKEERGEEVNLTILRYILEDSVDDEDLYIDAVTDEGEQIIAFAKRKVYDHRVRVYSDFMEILVEELKKEEEEERNGEINEGVGGRKEEDKLLRGS